MKRLIAYCGLDCEKCDAYIASTDKEDEHTANPKPVKNINL